jgi:superfamily II DNA/RNA helicase
MVVLDEADHLLEPTQWGFVKQIVTRTPKTYQYAAFSATADRANEELQALIQDAAVISIGAGESTVEHVYLEVENRKKIDTLRSLAHVDGMRALAFFNKLETLGGAEEKLQFKGVAAMSIASDVAGRFRKQLLAKFKDGDLVLLLATDIAARGIDIEGLEYVINFDVPVTQESYTHRVGRVGRMGRKGLVINLVGSPGELKRLKEYNPEVKPAKLSRGELTY